MALSQAYVVKTSALLYFLSGNVDTEAKTACVAQAGLQPFLLGV